jgi:hypothetical protein
MSAHSLNSELEKTNLEVHVDMARQRYTLLGDKVARVEERFDGLEKELSEFRKEHAQNISDLKHAQLEAIASLREEQAEDNNSTIKVVVGAAATVGAGLLSVIVVLLVAFL